MAKARVVNVQFNDEQPNFAEYANRLLAEGDSWFAWAHLNLVPSSNILEQLEFRDPTVIISLAYSGDVIRNMSNKRSNIHLFFELQALRYDAILLSGGGNDLIDALAPDRQPNIIVPGGVNPPGAADSYVDAAALKTLTDDVLASYRRIIAMRDTSDANAHTPIVLHTYDYPTPRNAKATFMGQPATGPWLLPAMEAAGVPFALYKDVTEIVYDKLGDALLSLHQPHNRVHVVNTCDTLARAELGDEGLSGDWINEIHPDAFGYALLARKISAELTGLGIA
jgi:hypothetical protein